MKYFKEGSLLLMRQRMSPQCTPQGERKVEPNPAKEQLALLVGGMWSSSVASARPCITKVCGWTGLKGATCIRRTRVLHHGNTAHAWAFPGACVTQPSTVLWIDLNAR